MKPPRKPIGWIWRLGTQPAYFQILCLSAHDIFISSVWDRSSDIRKKTVHSTNQLRLFDVKQSSQSPHLVFTLIRMASLPFKSASFQHQVPHVVHQPPECATLTDHIKYLIGAFTLKDLPFCSEFYHIQFSTICDWPAILQLLWWLICEKYDVHSHAKRIISEL